MKKIIFYFVCCLSFIGYAQQGINYKAIIKDNNGNVMTNNLILVEFTILQGVALTTVYKETHSPTTDANGLIILNIGEGTPTTGSFATINWGSNTSFLNTKINTGPGLIDMGTTEFKTVPYALNAKSVSGAKINDLLDGKSDANGSSLFIGLNAGQFDDGTNNNNVGIGSHALNSNTNGDFNIAIGKDALRNNTTGYSNTAIGVETLYSNTLGIRNVANGYRSLYSNTSGSSNTANGYRSLFSNTTGSNNIANGFEALTYNTTGGSNIANGYRALYFNSTGNNNTANGHNSLYSNTTGYSNTANGFEALYANNTGYGNSANGNRALYSNTTGQKNTANGDAALYNNTTGNVNVASGNEALYLNTTGSFNTANGFRSLYNNFNGRENSAYGIDALYNLTTGHNNTGIGYSAQVPNSTGSNQVRIGNSLVTYAGIQVAWTVTSDERWKDHIRPLPYGLNMVTQLQAVDYVRKNNETKTREIGFIAQEVKALLEKMGYTDQGILSTDDDGYMGLRYNDFIPVLVKAIQEQQDIINNQSNTINMLTAEADTNEKTLKAFDQRLVQIEALMKTNNQ